MIPVRKSRARPVDRVETGSQKIPDAQYATIPASVLGWNEGGNISAADPRAARVLENGFPTRKGIRVRGGRFKVADIGAPVTSIFSYSSASFDKMFAASETEIFDVSTLDPDVTPTASISGQSAGYYSTAQLGTVGGDFMYAVNGADKAQLFDGSSWAAIDDTTTPFIAGVDTADLSYVWVHKSRYWFIEKGTKIAWYLDVDSTGGEAADFSLNGVFQDGGSLLFGATWSQDAGDGMDDRIVFVSDQGEIAIYQGSNPANASTWALVGVYKIPAPLGPDAHLQAGGDVIIATESSFVPLSAISQKDPAALDVAAVSAAIEPTWARLARDWSVEKPWEAIKWPRENMVIVSVPTDGNTVLVANIDTGAWAKYTGWDMQCVTLHKRACYFGSKDGAVYAAERGGSDDGATYVCSWSCAPSDLGVGAAHKTVNLARATFLSSTDFIPKISFSTDYNLVFPAAPSAAVSAADGTALWDSGTWDSSLWDDDGSGVYSDSPAVTTPWASQAAHGFAIAAQMQITCGGDRRPDIEFLSLDIAFKSGGVVG